MASTYRFTEDEQMYKAIYSWCTYSPEKLVALLSRADATATTQMKSVQTMRYLMVALNVDEMAPAIVHDIESKLEEKIAQFGGNAFPLSKKQIEIVVEFYAKRIQVGVASLNS
ncbi:MAG: hypothetical protein M9928_21640 [Anaerolineae bacterium]|nr:hypothetical protein [Anaerolineae bacterium]MCO5195472.1 hypothetical protein [Anaerolineae bacterium]MCO5207619.1 hypothetical protein [Anaerolineae bacterium]